MTENKRFILEEFGLNFIVNDNGRNLTAKQTVDKLNQLYEENEQLKSKLSEQGTQIDFLKDENHHMKHVLNENKQLKAQLQSEHQMLDNAILLERTRMGKNSLIQYKEAIQ